MKKILVGTILPLIASAAIVGSGFSVWYFQDATGALNTPQTKSNVVIQNTSINGNSAAEFINLPTNLTLSLDQPATNNNNQKGASFATTDNGGFKAIKVQAKQGATDYVAPNSTVTTLLIPEALGNYLTVTYDNAEVENQKGTYTFTWDNATGFNWSEVTLAYKGIDTNNEADYQKLVTALAGTSNDDGTYSKSLSVTYTAAFPTK